MIPKPPQGVITIDHPKRRGTHISPVVTVIDLQGAEQWLEEINGIIHGEISSASFACCAPETHRNAYWRSLEFLVAELEKGLPLTLWDANRQIAERYTHFDDEGFSDACTALFE